MFFFFFNFENDETPSANKGEWSELYAHLRLLADGKVFSGDENYNKIEDESFPIIKIFRREAREENDTIYIVDSAKKQILIQGNKEESVISQDQFASMANCLLQQIKSGSGSAFRVSKIYDFMRALNMHKVKASSIDKQDIRIVLHDMHVDRNREMGFSIKSRLGGKSTLFNSNADGTNFRYQIEGDITDEQISYLNLISQYFRRTKNHHYTEEQVAMQNTAFESLPEEYKNRKPAFFSVWFSILEDWGCKLKYDNVVNSVFRNNLRNIDSLFHKVLAECLVKYYGHSIGNSVKAIIDSVAESDPCGIADNDRVFWYELVMKRFLIIVALGMTGNTPWNGIYAANGGFLVVKEDGDIVCYHFYDRNQLENYLLNNTAFETPSTSRHKISMVYRDNDGKVYLKLNPQIRFIHSLQAE